MRGPIEGSYCLVSTSERDDRTPWRPKNMFYNECNSGINPKTSVPGPSISRTLKLMSHYNFVQKGHIRENRNRSVWILRKAIVTGHEILADLPGVTRTGGLKISSDQALFYKSTCSSCCPPPAAPQDYGTGIIATY